MDSTQLSLRFLCVGVDPSFMALLLGKSESIDISLDSCKTTHEAKTKMEHSTYDIYVVDLHISEKTALELIQDIRKKEGNKCVIAVIASNYTEEEAFKILKEKGAVNLLLEKPIEHRQFEGFIQSIIHRFAPPSLPMAAGPITSKFDLLRRKYEKSIPEKIELLTNLILECQKNPITENFTELKSTVHKIGGSAGSYGFSQISSLCKELDIDISERLATGTLKEDIWLASLPLYIEKFESNFKKPVKKDIQINYIPPSQSGTSTVYIIDHDKQLLEALDFEKDEFKIDLIVDSDPEIALDRLSNGKLNPDALVVSQTFPNSSITAFDIINSQRQRLAAKTAVYVLILEEENIDTRIEAMRKGVHYIFHRPVKTRNLLKIIKEALQIKSLEHFKVLLLDDDVDFCGFVTLVLTEIGISVKSISDPKELFSTLEEFKPHVLMLDLMMPKYDGINLLKSIKQDIEFSDLIVLIVTSGDESITRLKAYSSNADDVLFKPIEIPILQKRILNFAERQKTQTKDPSDTDHTSLFNLKALATQINNFLAKAGRHINYLVIFEIDNITDLLLCKGYGAIKEILEYINKQIVDEYNGTPRCFTYNSSTFALIFDESDPVILEKKIFNFLTKVSQGYTTDKLNFNCSIIPISRKFTNTHQILHVATETLFQASNQEPAPVRIVTITSESVVQSNKVVVLVDSDRELLKILRAAFEARGIIVQTYVEGESALKDILALEPDHLPALFIVERKLIDMDGLDLIIKINDHFDTTVPFYILSIFSSDKDVSEGINQGALEYIGKPFNLTILMQKALKTIFK